MPDGTFFFFPVLCEARRRAAHVEEKHRALHSAPETREILSLGGGPREPEKMGPQRHLPAAGRRDG